MQNSIRDIYVDPSVAAYIVRLVGATRNHPDVYLGASPRGSIALYRAGQALAGLMGRDYVIPDDVKALAEPALAHRLIIKTSSSIHDVQAGQVVRELLESTAIDGIRPTGGGPTDLRPASRSSSAPTNAYRPTEPALRVPAKTRNPQLPVLPVARRVAALLPSPPFPLPPLLL